jgi:AAA15 family ATPase/GTPase
MLIRVLLQNLFSFQELTEFNMLPGRSSRLSSHIIKEGDVELLKLNAIYGANGAGKSNLILTLELLKTFLTTGQMPIQFITETFKFDENSRLKDVYIGVEFIKNNVPFFYGLTVNQGIITEEELLISGLGKNEDRVLFRRSDNVEHEALDILFHDGVARDSEASLFPAFLKHELLQRNQPVLFYMRNRQNVAFMALRSAIEWFEKDLIILRPNSKPSGIAVLFDQKVIKDFALSIMRSFDTGIADIKVETIPAEEYFGQDDKLQIDMLMAELKTQSLPWKELKQNNSDVLFTIENNKPTVKKIFFYHKEDGGKNRFEFFQESDGTQRLFEYIPVLFSLIYTARSFLIDEIERSIHPLLIK